MKPRLKMPLRTEVNLGSEVQKTLSCMGSPLPLKGA